MFISSKMDQSSLLAKVENTWIDSYKLRENVPKFHWGEEAGEVLWTPQKEEDTRIDHKLFKDYPELSKCDIDIPLALIGEDGGVNQE
ncbi:hypothetical protein QL285_060366 [Trifolium repens]|nr:hypothetical protein QL285_060366 [Trifolium repens]